VFDGIVLVARLDAVFDRLRESPCCGSVLVAVEVAAVLTQSDANGNAVVAVEISIKVRVVGQLVDYTALAMSRLSDALGVLTSSPFAVSIVEVAHVIGAVLSQGNVSVMDVGLIRSKEVSKVCRSSSSFGSQLD
jgi:hypothetical protein